MGKRRGVLGRLAPSDQAKFSRKLARRAQLVIVLRNSGKQQVNVDHKLNVGTPLSSVEIAQVAKALSPAKLVTFACSIVGNTVVNGMVGAHSPRKNGIKSGMGFAPRDPERVGPSRNKPIMKKLS